MKAIKAVAQKANGRIVIGETTPIQIGFVLAILALVFACVWWAATINAKLDVVVSKVNDVESNSKANRSDLDTIKLWRAEIDRSGSRALDEFRKEFQAFRTEFQVHVAQQAVKP